MANYRNYAVQIGYLGEDPEVRNTSGGKVITFRVATNKRWKDKKTGEIKESTFWRRYEAWNERGENIAAIMRKGDRIQVVSEPSNNEYEKDGVKHYRETHTVISWLNLAAPKLKTEDGEKQIADDGDDDIPY